MARATSQLQTYAPRVDPRDRERVREAARALGWLTPPRAAGPRPTRIPERPLKLGEYLFHAGEVTWKDVLEALRWQRAQRPLAGEVAVQLGFLTREAVHELIAGRCRERAFHLPFCAFAVARGALTEAQRTAIVGQQRRLQQRLGEWFVARGLLSAEELERLAGEHRLHNARWRVAAATRR